MMPKNYDQRKRLQSRFLVVSILMGPALGITSLSMQIYNNYMRISLQQPSVHKTTPLEPSVHKTTPLEQELAHVDSYTHDVEVPNPDLGITEYLDGIGLPVGDEYRQYGFNGVLTHENHEDARYMLQGSRMDPSENPSSQSLPALEEHLYCPILDRIRAWRTDISPVESISPYSEHFEQLDKQLASKEWMTATNTEAQCALTDVLNGRIQLGRYRDHEKSPFWKSNQK